MTDMQARQIVAAISLRYTTPAWAPEELEMFKQHLLDLPAEAASHAVVEWIRTAERRPSVAEFRRAVARATVPVFLDPDDAWGVVLNAIRMVGTYQPFPTTHPLVAAAVERMGWREICAAENLEVLRAQFTKIYLGLRDRVEREAAARDGARVELPPAIADMSREARPALQRMGGSGLALLSSVGIEIPTAVSSD